MKSILAEVVVSVYALAVLLAAAALAEADSPQYTGQLMRAVISVALFYALREVSVSESLLGSWRREAPGQGLVKAATAGHESVAKAGASKCMKQHRPGGRMRRLLRAASPLLENALEPLGNFAAQVEALIVLL
eukprot:TRINITY_DN53827_c1_g2_i3.p1 TRINITY_DN53827_c1_g2~~TRINITY_DN53827_c1_g2_i3.p1  ORF type:complete len:133 (-),score=37.45 TRINITY_DN53827_c1_g2_i3:134-532(-)